MTGRTLSRSIISLDGTWQFALDQAGSATHTSAQPWRSIDVPGPWQAQSDDLRSAQGVAWYRRSVEVPANWQSLQTLLCFGAVDHQAEVWVNGQLVGSHTGGYLPFEFDITRHVYPGQTNQLVVKVTDPDTNRSRWETPGTELPHGKQSWYGPLSGIWQSVRLEARAFYHLEHVLITPHVAEQQLVVELTLNQAAPVGSLLHLRVSDPHNQTVYSEQHQCDTRRLEIRIGLEHVVLWELDQPARYTLTASLYANDQHDMVQQRFGFRTLETRDGSLWLNGKPLMLRGALDQDYYPDMICTPPSYEFLLNQARLAKRMGLNCLRCHIKIADPRYLEAADEVGLLIWAELPNWDHWTPAGAEFGLQTLEAAIKRDWNHPSVMIWSVINESWGIDQSNPEHRDWLRSAYDRIKAMAGDRLVVDNSACFNNFHLKSDLDDYHFYAAMPDERLRWREWVEQFANRAPWSYGTELPPLPAGTERWRSGAAGYGKALPGVERSGSEPLIVSEFGNWGLPSLHELRGPGGPDPWWFETGDDWGDGVVYPHGVEQRFNRLGLARIFGDYEHFSLATRRAEFDALQFEIEEMRRHTCISGYVITEFTDVHWECNGLLDMRRNSKLPMHALAALNADTMFILDREQGALYGGSSQTISVQVSHWGAETIAQWNVRVRVQGDGFSAHFVERSVSLSPRSTSTIGALVLDTMGVEQPVRATVQLELWHGQRCIAQTSMNLAIYPRVPPVGGWYVYNAPALAQRLADLGYQLAETPGRVPTITTIFDEPLRQRVQQGEHVVLLAETPDAIQAALGPLAVRQRRGTAWQGSWASSFAWLRGSWAGDGLLDDSFMTVMPDHVITGFSQNSFPDSVQAGLCVGWIHKPVALLGTIRLGRGQVTVTTFRLQEALGSDPVADWLLQQIARG